MPNQLHEGPTADISKANSPCLSDNLTTLPLIARRQATIPQYAVQPLRRPPAPRYHRSYIGQPPSIPTADHHHPGGYAPATTSITDPNTIPALHHISTNNTSRSGGFNSAKLIATRPHHPAKAKAIQRSTLNNDAPTHTSNTPTHHTSSRPLTQDDKTRPRCIFLATAPSNPPPPVSRRRQILAPLIAQRTGACSHTTALASKARTPRHPFAG
jgi:hypothetical protein